LRLRSAFYIYLWWARQIAFLRTAAGDFLVIRIAPYDMIRRRLHLIAPCQNNCQSEFSSVCCLWRALFQA